MAVPALFIFILGVFGTSAMVRRPEWRPAGLQTYQNLFDLYGAFLSRFTEASSKCVRGTVLSDFEKQDCNYKLKQLLIMGAVGAIPWGLTAVFLMLGLDVLVEVYRRTRKKILKKDIYALGQVLNRPDLEEDRWCWFLCMRVIRVEVKKTKEKINAYIPLDMDIPQPGTEMALYQFKGLKIFYTAAPHTPHIAIVAGERVS